MTADDLSFHEIEHKFIVSGDFDVERFRSALTVLEPKRSEAIQVTDRYFLTADGRARGYVLRHRFDRELHHLTIKGMGRDTEVRPEVNLDLGHHAGDQRAPVDAFVAALGLVWSGTIEKELDVWYFEDCEVVYYRAATPARGVVCVEFEAKHASSIAAAVESLRRYEDATGFEPAARSHLSLLQLLYPEVNTIVSSGSISSGNAVPGR